MSWFTGVLLARRRIGLSAAYAVSSEDETAIRASMANDPLSLADLNDPKTWFPYEGIGSTGAE